MLSRNPLFIAIAGLAFSAAVQAEGLYVSGSLSYNDQDDISTDGRFTRDFVTGGPVDVLLPIGTGVRWDTETDSGYGVNLAVGWRMQHFRVEAEYAYAKNDVDKHKNVRVAGVGNIDALDASVLVEGAADVLGATVGQVVRNGKGDIGTDYLFVNAFYDFDMGSSWSPYVGVGIGSGWVDVEYKPSNIKIIDDDDRVFAWQVMAGLSYLCSEQLSFFGGVRWRQTDDVEVRSSLLPANFDLNNENFIAEGGLRWHF